MMSDQLTPDEIAYIADWLSKPEVRTALVSLVKLFASQPPAQVPSVHIGGGRLGGADMVGGGVNIGAVFCSRKREVNERG